jgi:hypothetical protein
MGRGDAFSNSIWGVVVFFVQIHGANIRIIGERDAGEDFKDTRYYLWQFHSLIIMNRKGILLIGIFEGIDQCTEMSQITRQRESLRMNFYKPRLKNSFFSQYHLYNFVMKLV